MTNILSLPLVSLIATAGTDEDWIDAIAFTTAAGAGLDLTGIAFTLDISTGTSTALSLSTGAGTLSLVQGAGSTVNNVLLINVPAASKAALTSRIYLLSGSASADGHVIDVIIGSLSIRQSY